MALVTFYFELHQPFRLHPDCNKFLWDESNRQIFDKVAEKCYIPATEMFLESVRHYPNFKITFSMSGTFLEQAEHYCPKVIELLHALNQAGQEHRQVEYLEETYYHSLTGLFADPTKNEFKDQVTQHRLKMRDLFGVRPSSFRNTELMYNNEIAECVNEMGFKAILCEQRNDMFEATDGKKVSPNAVFRAKGNTGQPLNLLVLARNRDLSDDIAFRYRHGRLSPQEYADYLAKVDGETVVLGYDYEHIGEHMWADTGIFDFWRALPAALDCHSNIVMANPTEIAEKFEQATCPLVDIHPLSTSSWADARRDTYGWLGTRIQHQLFRDIEHLEKAVKRARGDLLKRWRYLTTSDHLYYLHEEPGADGGVHQYFSPYGTVSNATYILTRNVDRMETSVNQFNIFKKTTQTPVIIITPETARLPTEGLGKFAQFVSGKSGGLGEVVAALCQGLAERKIPSHIITLNLQRRFQEESQMSSSEWIQNRHKIDPENIHLVTSSIFEGNRSAYDGDPIETAAEFQRQCVNTYIKDIRSKYDGKAILHTHDWMAGGVISAYALLRQIPTLHTVHNTHTGEIPIPMFHGVNIGHFWQNLYVRADSGQECVDCHATAIKCATRVSYVGKTFLNEIVHDFFLDRPIIPWSVRQETKAKFSIDAAVPIPNGISPTVFPENQHENPAYDQPGLACTYGPNDDLVAAKKANLAKFQRQMGLVDNPDAILLYWPSRLDVMQKGVELLEDIALKFVIENADVQIAIVGNPVGSDRTHSDIIGRIAWASNGKVAYRTFDEKLSILGYAAASDVFGASLYEPFGQIDVVGNIYGATATNRQTGGYADKIIPLSLKAWGAPKDTGNGVLFKTYDSGGLWWGLHQTVQNHRYFRQNLHDWQQQMKRIMVQARLNWSLETMVAGYITEYEKLSQIKH